METISVDVHRAGQSPRARAASLEQDLARVRQLAQLLDARFEIAGIRFGWDSIIGLVPVAGDLVTTAIGAYPLYIAHRHGLGRLVRARMAGNLLLDWALGSIPLAGDLFDVGFKAHLKNAALLERAAEAAKRRRHA
jgi:hypothetical protein